MSYITRGNVSKIITQINIDSLPVNFADSKGKVYKKEIWFFNNLERNRLLVRKELHRNPSSFIEFYNKIGKRPDTYKYIYEGGTPAFHSTLDCDRLTSNFTAYEVPFQIQEKGPKAVSQFRLWFSQNKELFDKNLEAFYGKMVAAFGIDEPIKPVNYENSGIELKENINLAELEGMINDLLWEASRFIVRSTELEQKVIKRFGKLSYLAYTKREIELNDTDLSDDQLKELLKVFSEKFKKPIIKYLEEYYKVYFNPELKFEGHLLEAIGFKKCSHCHDDQTIIV